MGNGLCMGGSAQVVPSYLVEQQPINVQQLVTKSKARHFPFEGVGPSSPSREVCELGHTSGECLFFLEFAHDVPYQDTLRDITCEAVSTRSHGNPYVRAWAEGEGGQQLGRVAEWPSKPCNETPSWYSAQSLGFRIAECADVLLRVELWDQRLLLGSASTPLSSLPAHASVALQMESRATTQRKPIVVSFQILNLDAVMQPRTVFFVRHGESVWNKAQSKMQLHEMARTTDHPLSTKGRDQAEALASRLADASNGTKESLKKVAPMLSPDVVYVSPLTRAVQTAVIALGPHLVSKPDGMADMVLMANAREKLNFGGLDTRSTKLGTEILQRVLDELRALYKGQETGVMETFAKLRFDMQEVQDRWWCEGIAEQPAQVQVRLNEFMSQLMYSPHRSIVVVGHSHFFRAVIRKFLSEDLKLKRPQLAHDIMTKKLMNCGVMRVEIDPARGLTGGPIVGADLVLSTELLAEGGGLLSCCVSTGVGIEPGRSGGAGAMDEGEEQFSPELSPSDGFTEQPVDNQEVPPSEGNGPANPKLLS